MRAKITRDDYGEPVIDVAARNGDAKRRARDREALSRFAGLPARESSEGRPSSRFLAHALDGVAYFIERGAGVTAACREVVASLDRRFLDTWERDRGSEVLDGEQLVSYLREQHYKRRRSRPGPEMSTDLNGDDGGTCAGTRPASGGG